MAVNHYPPSSSSSSQEPDEISLFLNQIILRSSASSSSSYSFMPPQAFAAENQQPATVDPRRITVAEYPPGGANFSSSCFWNFENEPDEFEDYESEEAAASGGKPTPSRNSSKRSRAAEVHNLSEKRRRSRINEKMKALQNLIPNANKTDKASMLDEAIEYLKQLQLQVQLLTMRNGLSLYPICLPGAGMMQQRQISRMRIDVCDEQDKPLTTSNNNMASAVSMDQIFSSDALNNLHDSRGKQSRSSEFSMMVGSSRSSFKMEQSMRQPFRPFQLSQSSHKGICYKGLPFQQTLEQDQHSNDRSSHKENKTSEPCLAGPDHLLAGFVNNPIFSSPLNM